ncbi:hypothetical protein SISNIDRAFT_472397 [Sistotremastrum niveocremeum HHB9708]|uniref:RRM domain-containing protein n=1 Tax=Sistotremastrum niveocremeum HHB9708 TaxID=1314777 RepID=A0A165A5J1_9AGAM|nr:hypothetical protein SISNIDRAFT_472397 [Sistotremastrum niveocremeum HHB9708]
MQMPAPVPQYMGPLPHPYLQEPILYLAPLPPHVTDHDLARALEHCIPFRPSLHTDPSGRSVGGTIEFKHLQTAEKAIATLQGRPIPFLNPPVLLSLSPFPITNPPTPLPPPIAQPRLIKHLPPGFTDAALFDLFRPYGSLASAKTQVGFGKDTAIVEFWHEEEARAAEEALHCAEVGGQNIAVTVYHQRRTSGNMGEFSPTAPAFVPSGLPYTYSPQTPPRQFGYPIPGTASPPGFMHGPGQQVQLAPLVGPGANSHSGLIDPCNLFCKNLDPEIDSNGLFTHFRQVCFRIYPLIFGQIVSARVMRNDNGQSRGFGFVSYQTPEQAANALRAMNGVVLGSKQIIVRLHEPKQLRQEKLAQRFAGHNGHPRSGSGATSPTLSDGTESLVGWPSPAGHAHPGMSGAPERQRKNSESYLHAALSGNWNSPMRYDELAALSPVVRKEVLTGELSRRVKNLEGVAVAGPEVESVVQSLLGLSLTEVVDGIQDTTKLTEQVKAVKDRLAAPSQSSEASLSNSPAPSQDSALMDSKLLDATASAPEHPSTPLSLSVSLSSPPRTSSPSGSVAPTSEKERLIAAVSKLEPAKAVEITDLLMSLTKRERALCLFSTEVLKQKVAEAKEVVELVAAGDEGDDTTATAMPTPITPHAKKASISSVLSPHTPVEAADAPVSADVPSRPATTAGVTSSPTYTLTSLARLPASEIIKIATSSPNTTGLPLPKSDPTVVKETDEFIDSLKGQTSSQQKQAVGEKLFKFVKSSGFGKTAGKITIQLLDSEDLRALAHLLNSYPSVLKEKITVFAQGGTPSK